MHQSEEMQRFREMGEMEEVARKQQDHRILREEVIETAGEGGGNVADLGHVAEAVAAGVNPMDALRA